MRQCGQKSCWSHHLALVAQLVERFTRNEGVVSSNLTVGSKNQPFEIGYLFLWKKTKDGVRFPVWKLVPHYSISIFVGLQVTPNGL